MDNIRAGTCGCCDVTGIDLSEQGIKIARRTHSRGRFEVLPADENLLANLGCDPFDLVLSTEVRRASSFLEQEVTEVTEGVGRTAVDN